MSGDTRGDLEKGRCATCRGPSPSYPCERLLLNAGFFYILNQAFSLDPLHLSPRQSKKQSIYPSPTEGPPYMRRTDRA